MCKLKNLRKVMKITVAELSEESGVPNASVQNCLKRGTTAERAEKVERAHISIAEKRIEKANSIMEGLK